MRKTCPRTTVGGEGGCGPTAVEEVPVLPVPWCLCVCVPVCPFVPVSICLWVCAGGCPKTPLVSVRPFTSVLCENYSLTGERALFSRCTEWGLGLGAGGPADRFPLLTSRLREPGLMLRRGLGPKPSKLFMSFDLLK